MNTNNIIKLVLSVLLFLCLLNMPYGYYQLVRVITAIAFVYFAFENYKNGNNGITLIYLGLAILFQPLVKIALGRVIWNIVDVIIGIGLIVSIFLKPRESK